MSHELLDLAVDVHARGMNEKQGGAHVAMYRRAAVYLCAMGEGKTNRANPTYALDGWGYSCF
jgi:hypothetical protein